ncbi:hypothetical protein E4U50_007331 [Claviceps purpurea]|nr:hypothetical protein E4U50_007331 [Claviceps purpurea]
MRCGAPFKYSALASSLDWVRSGCQSVAFSNQLPEAMSLLLAFAIDPVRISSQMSSQAFMNVALVVTLENTYGYLKIAHRQQLDRVYQCASLESRDLRILRVSGKMVFALELSSAIAWALQIAITLHFFTLRISVQQLLGPAQIPSCRQYGPISYANGSAMAR